MKNSIWAVVIVVTILLAGGFIIYFLSSGDSNDKNDENSNAQAQTIAQASGTKEVNIIANNFTPSTITIKAGDTVTWTNNDTISHLVASDPHPAHTDLLGFESEVFVPGESYSYTFDEAGTFNYHCHLHPEMLGTVIVE